MSQALASLSRNLISLLICITLAACNGSYTAFESDVDFNTDVKTADIEQDNAELMALAVYQSAFLGHHQSAAYLFLDASDLPADAILQLDESDKDFVSVSQDNQFKRICSNSGKALYSYTRDSGEAHKAGDRISIRYDNCLVGDVLYNGSMTATYSKIRGLNDRFVNLLTSECVENTKKDLSVIDVDIISVTGDELRFTKISEDLKVDVILIEGSAADEDRTEIVQGTYYIDKSDAAILVLSPSNLPADAVTSVNGDQVYSIVDAIHERRRCQNYERTLNVQFDNFSTDKEGYLFTSLNGSVTLLETQETATRVNQSFVNSNFQTTVRQGNLTQSFNMKNYSVEKSASTANKSYVYEFKGLINNSNAFGGQVELTTTLKLLGSSDNTYPHAGGLEFKGIGLERINLIPDNLNLQLQVDYNGDSTGNGFGDFDLLISTNWSDLFAREFKE